MREKTIDISIVIPCYNEMEHINDSFKELADLLNATKLAYELIFIDDYSTDGTPYAIEMLCKNHSNMHFYQHSVNVGRGGTVSEGIIKARGDVVGFIDIDLEVQPLYILPCYMAVKQGFDVVIAHRRYNIKFGTFVRWVLSRCYNNLVRKMLGIPFTDTEAGYKFFNREKILPLLKATKNKKWFWDTEIVALAYLQKYRIKEIPVLFVKNDKKTSTLHIFVDSKDYFVNLMRFRKEVQKIKSSAIK